MRGFNLGNGTYNSKSFYEVMSEHLKEWDTYFYPYMLVEKAFGNILRTVLFPVIGYFVLQSKYPVRFFKQIIGHLAEKYKDIKKEKILINKFWRENFNEIHQECIRLMFELYGGAFTPGWDVIMSRQFNDHSVCSFYRYLLSYTQQVISQKGLNLDMFFALPGDPNCRHLLATSFRPPVTLLNGGYWTVEDVSEFNPLLDFEDAYGRLLQYKIYFRIHFIKPI